jgi:predicted acetylornithine/succinylornithine family transaminase
MDIREEFDHYFLDIYGQVDFVPVSGIGSRLYGANREEVIDFAGGVAVNALGHCHPQLVAKLNDQAKNLWHVSNIMVNKPALELGKKLVKNTCFDKVFFCNSGTEAVEAGLKLARNYAHKKYGAHKNKVVSFINSFHGRTLFSVAAGGQSKYWEGFAPLPGGIAHGVFNDCDSLDAVIDEDTAVVIVEVIQAEGGVIPVTAEFLAKLRQLCDKFNVILMFDEVQTGIGRTGRLFAYQHYAVEPDMISIAKALGCGFPIGGILVKEKFSSGFTLGSHGSTFGGNPLACSIASTAFDIINQTEILDGVLMRNKVFMQILTKINDKLDIYKEIRGEGLLIGAQLHDKYANMAKKIMKLGFKHGVATLMASTHVTRFTPSLIIPLEDIDLGMERFDKALIEFKTLTP